MTSHKETLTVLGDELTRLEAEIGRLRLTRERTTYRLEQRVRERDRVARHLASLVQESMGFAMHPASAPSILIYTALFHQTTRMSPSPMSPISPTYTAPITTQKQEKLRGGAPRGPHSNSSYRLGGHSGGASQPRLARRVFVGNSHAPVLQRIGVSF